MNEYIPLTIHFVSETLNNKAQICRESKFPDEFSPVVENLD